MLDKKQIEEPVFLEIQRFNEEFTTSLQSQTQLLQSAIDKILEASGKHIRPLLVLLSAKACGKIGSQSIDAAVLLELLHTASLIHDDVVDETRQRRGHPSLNAIFDNRIAVLVGDYFLSTSLIRCMHTGNMKIVGVISNLGRDLSEGEIKQMETADESILDENCYLQVIYKKTATLLSACAEIGALSVNASSDLVQMMREFGKFIGYSFQIRDDIFDYFVSPELGKPTGNDIREGKVTLPLLYALRIGKPEESAPLLDIIHHKDFTEDHIAMLVNYAKDNGGIQYAEQKMYEYKDKALLQIAALPDSNAKKSLEMLADYIIERTK